MTNLAPLLPTRVARSGRAATVPHGGSSGIKLEMAIDETTNLDSARVCNRWAVSVMCAALELEMAHSGVRSILG